MAYNLPSNRIFYACTIGHDVRVEITNNNASNKGIALCLTCAVLNDAPHSEDIFRRTDRFDNEYQMPDDMGHRILLSKAKGLIKSLEEDYGLTFMYGQEAWDDRMKVYVFDSPQAKWTKYMETCDNGPEPMSLESRKVLLKAWNDAWAASDNVNKQEFIDYANRQMESE